MLGDTSGLHRLLSICPHYLSDLFPRSRGVMSGLLTLCPRYRKQGGLWSTQVLEPGPSLLKAWAGDALSGSATLFCVPR